MLKTVLGNYYGSSELNILTCWELYYKFVMGSLGSKAIEEREFVTGGLDGGARPLWRVHKHKSGMK